MKLIQRNKRPIYYALYEGVVNVVDSHGNYTGIQEVSYSDPVKMKVSISMAKGNADTELFGVSDNYTNVIITDDMDCPIDEKSILWINQDTSLERNYIVIRKAEGLNYIAYAVRKVDANGNLGT